MKLETFFEKFDRFADAPDAVEKMRELLRHLAVTGSLVHQDPNDEPADELLAGVVSALPDKKSENPFLGKIESSITDESEYQLPPGWAWMPLGHVGIWATGCGFPMQYQGESDREFLFCKVSDMNLPGNEVEIHTTVHSVDTDVVKKIRARANPVGTVIFPKIGGAIATHKRRLVIKPTIIDNNCSGIQPIGLTDDRWLLLFMRTLDLTKYQSGTSVPAVSQGSLDPIRIGLPPLAEQKRIVAKVDELMALCDQLEEQQQERETRHAALARASLARFAGAPTPANLSFLFHSSYTISPADLRRSILTLAVQGKLVPQDPNDEPAERLIARLEVERRHFADAHKFRSPAAEPVDESSVPFDIPTSWRWCRLSSMFNAVTDGDHLPPPKSDNGVAFLTIGNITTGKLDFDESRFVPETYYRGLADFRRPVRRDILYTVVGATYGRAALVETDRPFCVQRHIAILKSPQIIEVGFLMAVLRSPLAYEQATASTTGTAQPTIPLGALRNFTAPLPPLDEQRRIVVKVDQLMALVDALETQLAASRATGANLLEAVVAELTAA